MHDEVQKHRCVKRLILNDYFSVWNCIKYKAKQPRSVFKFYYPMPNSNYNCSLRWLLI